MRVGHLRLRSRPEVLRPLVATAGPHRDVVGAPIIRSRATGALKTPAIGPFGGTRLANARAPLTDGQPCGMRHEQDGDELEHLSSEETGRLPPVIPSGRGKRHIAIVLAILALVVATGSVGLIAVSLHTRLREVEREVDVLQSQVSKSEALLSEVRADRYLTVPNVVGIRFREAKAILLVGGFTTSPDPGNLDSVVLRQYPEPGIRVEQGVGVVVLTE